MSLRCRLGSHDWHEWSPRTRLSSATWRVNHICTRCGKTFSGELVTFSEPDYPPHPESPNFTADAPPPPPGWKPSRYAGWLPVDAWADIDRRLSELEAKR